MATSLPEFTAFDCSEATNLGPRWKKWMARLEILITAIGVNNAKQKKALFLHYMGEQCYDVYETLKDDDDTFDNIKTKLDDYFVPKVNEEYEKYVFRNSKQKADESLDQLCTRLKKMAATCGFTDVNAEVKSQIIQGCTSSQLRKKALSKDMTLDELITTGKAMELAQTQAQLMGDSNTSNMPITETVNKIQANRKVNTYEAGKKCYSCGESFPHQNECRARNRRCYNCNQLGHLSKCCRRPQRRQYRVNQVLPEQSGEINQLLPEPRSENEYSFNLKGGLKQIPKTNLNINGIPCSLMIDTGASINILDKTTFEKIRENSIRVCKMQKTDTNLFAYGSKSPLPLMGKFEAYVTTSNNMKASDAYFYVTSDTCGNLLSFETANRLGLISITNAVIEDHRINTTENIIKSFPDVFQGLGKLKDFQLKLNIDNDIEPVHQKHRRVPFVTRDMVEREIKKLYEEDICEDVGNNPTPWVSPIVAVPKPHNPQEVRICVDMRAPNMAIKRVKHPMPTLDEIIHDLNGCTVFSKLDLNQAYHQIELHPDSRFVTVFSTHMGLHRYKRLNYGVNAASEKFQQILEDTLSGLDGVRNIADDIIIGSKNDKEHEIQIRACLKRIREKGLTLNNKKCVFFKNKIDFFGNVFAAEGMSPHPNKVKAIRDAPRPEDKTQVRSLLGMVNYVQRYIPNMAMIAKPLRELTKLGTTFIWDEKCEEAFNKIKDSITSEATLAYFDPKLSTELIVDASPVGIGAILTQRNNAKDINIIAYASRTLNEVEARYSQVEREALGLRWGIEHFHLYLYGIQFSVITDHQPLISIFKNPLARPSPRIERWCLRLQQYNFIVQYQKGSKNPADYMSRHPVKTTSDRESKMAEEYANFVMQAQTPKAISIKELADATRQDSTMMNVEQCIKKGDWYKFNNEEMIIYQKVASELCILENGIIMRGARIVIPVTLRKKIVQLAHEGHMGIVKTKLLLRSKVWFPNMDKLVEEVIQVCPSCNIVVKEERLQPLIMSELPSGPWLSLAADFSGPYPSGEYCLVVIDSYSRFPVVEVVNSTSARTVIPVLDKIFAMHGQPEKLKTDNGPPFQSSEFSKFMSYSGVQHQKITPLWPRANGLVENFMKPLNKAIKTATVEGKSWKQEMYKFLRNYRATPHTTTGVSPAVALYGRNIRTLIPEMPVATDDFEMRHRDRTQKEKQKFYADKKLCTRMPQDIQVGDTVLIKKQKENKLSPAYMTQPMNVISRKGTMVTAGNRMLGNKTRNVSHFKKIFYQEPNVNYEPQGHNAIKSPENIGQDTGFQREQPCTQVRGRRSTLQTPIHRAPSETHTQDVVPVQPPPEPPQLRPRRNLTVPVKYNDFEVNWSKRKQLTS